MASAPGRLLVSILHWNAPDSTARCVAALRDTAPDVAVLVVDNGSRDDDEATLRRVWPALHWRRAPHNLGFAAGHALAVDAARQLGAEAVLLLNNDAEPQPGCIAQLCAAWQAHGDALYGALTGHRDEAGRDWLEFPAKFLDPAMRPAAWRRDRPLADTAEWRQAPPRMVAAVLGSCLLVPLALVERHGWMDPGWFMYCEEIDYCLRLRAAGVRSWLVPQARCRHRGEGSARRWPAVADGLAYYRARNEIEWARRHAGTGTALAFALKKLLRALAEAPRRPRRAGMILRALADAARGRLGARVALDPGLPG